jgi:hypothetical protein
MKKDTKKIFVEIWYSLVSEDKLENNKIDKNNELKMLKFGREDFFLIENNNNIQFIKNWKILIKMEIIKFYAELEKV